MEVDCVWLTSVGVRLFFRQWKAGICPVITQGFKYILLYINSTIFSFDLFFLFFKF